jgi:hypothetical protein
MKKTILFTLAMSAVALISSSALAATLATATFDTDSYIFVGTNAQNDAGITIGTDFSAGVLHTDNTHFNFGVLQFGNLTGIQTVANGGPSKYLKLWTHTFPGSSTIAVSVAKADINNDANGYPGGFFYPGNPSGTDTARLQWYFNNIKGNDATYGGYAGGANHAGILNVTAAGMALLDVTAVVDAWIDGSVPNYGFGLWGVNVSGGQGNTFDFASMSNPSGLVPQLSSSVPEPGSLVLGALSVIGLPLSRSPQRVSDKRR